MSFHRLLLHRTGRHMIATVYDLFPVDGEVVPYWSAGSASGPMRDFATDMGELLPGDTLNLSYDYEAGDYGLFRCTVLRVNRKSVSVQSHQTGATVKVTL